MLILTYSIEQDSRWSSSSSTGTAAAALSRGLNKTSHDFSLSGVDLNWMVVNRDETHINTSTRLFLLHHDAACFIINSNLSCASSILLK